MSQRTQNVMKLLLNEVTQHQENLMLEVLPEAHELQGDADLCEKLCKLHEAYQTVIDHLTERLEQ